jgi:hypothetical protein
MEARSHTDTRSSTDRRAPDRTDRRTPDRREPAHTPIPAPPPLPAPRPIGAGTIQMIVTAPPAGVGLAPPTIRPCLLATAHAIGCSASPRGVSGAASCREVPTRPASCPLKTYTVHALPDFDAGVEIRKSVDGICLKGAGCRAGGNFAARCRTRYAARRSRATDCVCRRQKARANGRWGKPNAGRRGRHNHLNGSGSYRSRGG